MGRETGGLCKKCGHKAHEHWYSFSEYSWFSESCDIKDCNCDEYIDSDKIRPNIIKKCPHCDGEI